MKILWICQRRFANFIAETWFLVEFKKKGYLPTFQGANQPSVLVEWRFIEFNLNFHPTKHTKQCYIDFLEDQYTTTVNKEHYGWLRIYWKVDTQFKWHAGRVLLNPFFSDCQSNPNP